MKIELKNIKYAAFASQETSCYEATIYIDGKKRGTVKNDGYGGSDNVHPWQLANEIDEYAKNLPFMACSFDDPRTGKPAVMAQDHETIFNDLLQAYLLDRDLKRAMSRRILFRREGKLMETNAHSAAELKARLGQGDLAAKLRAEVILNLLPFADASAIYRARA
jgi:hypothetical protein